MLNLVILFQSSDDGPVYVAEILVNMTKESAKSRLTAAVKPCPPDERGEMQVGLELVHDRSNTVNCVTNEESGHEVIKLVFVFNSAEHEISIAHIN